MSGVYFAYDASIHGDWVSHYAARMAAAHKEKILHLVYVREGRMSDAHLQRSITQIGVECQRLGVELDLKIRSPTGTLVETIRSTVPPGKNTYLICGTKSREKTRRQTSGGISRELLRSSHCHILILRVFQPGLLGLPRRLLLPLSGHPHGLRSGLPLLALFTSHVSELHLLHVVRVSPWRLHALSHEAVERLRRPGQTYCERIEQEIRNGLGPNLTVLDARVVVSDDVSKEIVITANKTKSQLIFLGASQRGLAKKFFFGNPIEQMLRHASCDVAIYRGFT